MQWYFTRMLVSFITLASILIVGVVGIIRETYLSMIAMIVMASATWYIIIEIIDFLKPMPPVKMIPMPLPPRKDDNNGTTEDSKR